MHAYELEAVNQSLHYEFMVGQDGLSEQFSSLFLGSVDSLLNKDNVSKLQWLHTVWLARDKLRQDTGLDPWPRDPVAATFLQRSKIRKKRQRRL